MKKLSIIIVLLFLKTLHAQNWVVGHSSNSNNPKPVAALTTDNSYFSIHNETRNNLSCFRIVKFDNLVKNVLFDLSYQSNSDIIIQNSLVCADGNIVLLGSANGLMYYCKINKDNGSILYTNTINAAGTLLKAIVLTKSFNDIAFVGVDQTTRKSVHGRFNESTGNILWSKISTKFEIFRNSYGLCEIDNGNIVLAGSRFTNANLGDNAIVVVDQGNGSNLSTRFWNNTMLSGVTFCDNSNIDNIINIPGTNNVALLYHIVGFTGFYDESTRDYGVALYNPITNTMLWDVRYERNPNDGERGSDIMYNQASNQLIVSSRITSNIFPKSKFLHYIDANNGVTSNIINLDNIAISQLDLLYKISPNTISNGILLSFVNSLNNEVLTFNHIIGSQSNCFINDNIQDIQMDIASNVFGYDKINLTEIAPFPLVTNENSNNIELRCGGINPPCLIEDPEINILNAQNITTDQIYKGKYLVTGRVVFLGNITVDITNCDFIFTDCNAGLYFIQGAKLRANNSVFRPCNENAYWEGITFYNTGPNKVHACIFKNAINGIHQLEQSSESIVTNSLFQNCFRGILFENSNNTGSIASNTFDVSNANADVPLTCLDGTGFIERSFNGIRALNSNIKSSISQNNFVCQISANTNDRMKGIVLENSTANITKNNFTNMDMAIRIVDRIASTPMEISSNEFEYHNKYDNLDPQIFILNSKSNITLSYNTINDRTNKFLSDAIEVINTSVNINENKINGFRTAIKLGTSSYCKIMQNEITNPNTYGIFSDYCNNIHISCNTIKMYKSPQTAPVNPVNPIGIALFENDLLASSVSNVRSNCVFDAFIALNVSKLQPNNTTPIPDIRNNFFYNYTFRGMNFENCTGNVGSASAYGRNTLYTNIQGASDVYSNQPFSINLYYNYMLSPVAPNVNIYNNLEAHSNANCANQVNLSQKVSGSNIITCDYEFPLVLIPGDFGPVESKRPDLIMTNMLNAIDLKNENYSIVRSAPQYNSLSDEQKLYIDYHYNYVTSNFTNALSILVQLQTINPANPQYRILAEKMKSLSGQYTQNTSGIFFSDSAYNYYSVSNLNLNPKNAYNYFSSPYPELKISESKQYASPAMNSFIIYPNPAKNETTIKVDNYDSKDVIIKVVDVTGKVLYEVKRTENNVNILIPLSDFNAGIYIISVQIGDVVQSQKLVIY